jgi:hypothetical protein
VLLEVYSVEEVKAMPNSLPAELIVHTQYFCSIIPSRGFTEERLECLEIYNLLPEARA